MNRLRRGVRYSRDDSEFDRAIGFLDATFALALTLLVTTLDVDDVHSAWQNLGSLGDEVGSQFVAFLIAFVLIANYWLVHHRMVSSFAAIDPPVIVANLVLIASVVVIPFTTEAVGEPANEGLTLPTVVFAANIGIASILSTFVYFLAWKRDLLKEQPSRAELRANLLGGLVPAAVFLGSIPIALLVSPTAAKLSWISLLILKPLANPPSGSKREAA
jgi:uncharacterized membrane protein